MHPPLEGNADLILASSGNGAEDVLDTVYGADGSAGALFGTVGSGR